MVLRAGRERTHGGGGERKSQLAVRAGTYVGHQRNANVRRYAVLISCGFLSRRILTC